MRKIAFVALALLISGSAFAQTKPKDALGVPGGIIHAPTTTASGAGDVLAQLRAKFTADITDDLTSALALANQKADPNGPVADSTAVPCYTALLSLNTVINSYTPPAGKPHVISDLEQLRIVSRTIQSTNFKDACAPLVQDIQSQANQLIASVLGIVTGAARIGLAIP